MPGSYEEFPRVQIDIQIAVCTTSMHFALVA
jgi:hypothetical protein